jgi:hypothetical protein
MLHMCVCMHSHFVENHPIKIMEDGPLISEVVLSQRVSRISAQEVFMSSKRADTDGAT